MKKKLYVLIPCYNEEESIGNLLSEFHHTRFPDYLDVQIVVINDCSSDKTKECAKLHHVAILDLPINLGIGGAMQTGFKYALAHQADFVVQMDGDGQHPPSELVKMIDYMFQNPCHLVIGSRFIERKGFQSSVLRRSGIAYLAFLSRLFTGKNIKDITSGFRMMNREVLELVSNSYPDEYPEPDSAVTFSRHGFIIKELPVQMRNRQGGISSITYFSQLYYIVKVTLAMFFSYLKKY